MNRKIQEALDLCVQMGINQAVFAIPFQISQEDVLTLKAEPVCNGMVLSEPLPELVTRSFSQWLGHFNQSGNWHLPKRSGALIFLGSQWLLTRRMMISALLRGRSSIICIDTSGHRRLWLYRVLLWDAGSLLRNQIRKMPLHSPVRKCLYWMAGFTILRKIWRITFKRSNASREKFGGNWVAGEEIYRELFIRAREATGLKIMPVPGRVVLVNAGLGAGGAERQIVNTLVGLRDMGVCESVALLAEHIDLAPELDFYLAKLQAYSIEVAQVKKSARLTSNGLSTLPFQIAEIMALLPSDLIEDTVNLIEEFRARRPSVVHAWQDSTSIKAGIAALLAGVPRVVLGGRSVAPVNFPYLKSYMRPAYRALAEVDTITLINNSEAGANDYGLWLGIDRDRFSVIRNGVDLKQLRRPDKPSILRYREALGIPRGARIVGSVFRFSEEKRPILWLESAVLVAEQIPEVHFLIIGEGPLRKEMEGFVRINGLGNRVHMPGTHLDIATPLAAMDAFVLTSKIEGTPNAVLEAQWLGIPVIVTEAGGARESFDENKTGWLVREASPEEVSSMICFCLQNEKSASKRAQYGPRFVEKVFGSKRMIDETLRAYGFRDNKRNAGPFDVVNGSASDAQGHRNASVGRLIARKN